MWNSNQQAIRYLKKSISRALGGGDDPSVDETAIFAATYLRQHCPCDDADKLDGLSNAILTPSRFAQTARMVVLARAHRYLTQLSMWLEDHVASPAHANDAPADTTSASPSHVVPELLALKGVGPKTAEKLINRGLDSPRAILYHLPRSYDDRRHLTPMSDLVDGQRTVTSGIIDTIRQFGRPWKPILEVVLTDKEHRISAIWFSNMRPRRESFQKGTRLFIGGIVSQNKGRLQMAHPIIATQENRQRRFDRIVPIYPDIPGIPGRTMEKIIADALCRVETYVTDPIPLHLRQQNGLISIHDALRNAHCPPSDATNDALDRWIQGDSPTHRRLAYDEFFFIQLALGLRKTTHDREIAPPLNAEQTEEVAHHTGHLMGFSPTNAQERVIREITADMKRPHPMKRLLQGDVGSGKTMIALAAILTCVGSGYQAALMAPTEILAEQHMKTLHPILNRLNITSALHIGAARTSCRKQFKDTAQNGRLQVAIGTHALIQESVLFHKLGLAVVDEQHRFGVSQRLGLTQKGPAGSHPHLLVMTATPIPRSLALTVHGDLDISVLDGMPPGRHPVSTHLLSPDRREEALDTIAQAISQGEQAYVVCPLIAPSEHIDALDATTAHQRLVQRFGETDVGLLHGQLPPDERDATMRAFVNGHIRLLVATTVIEVGVDVPNATVMLIEGAQQFGMAQLHQLRGRVGRSHLKSTCFLVATPKTDETRSRLQAMVDINDGFQLAERDLQLRGPGELYGKRQAGLPGFRFANIQRDERLLTRARQDAFTLLQQTDNLTQNDSLSLRQELERRIEQGIDPVGEEAG